MYNLIEVSLTNQTQYTLLILIKSAQTQEESQKSKQKRPLQRHKIAMVESEVSTSTSLIQIARTSKIIHLKFIRKEEIDKD